MGDRVASEEEKWKEINENWWLRHFLRSKWKIPIIAMLIAIIFLSLLFFEILPGTYGNHFVSVKWEITGYLNLYGEQMMNVTLPGGLNVSCGYVAPWTVEVSNSYFMPVRIHGNEFAQVFLVYDQIVSNPRDVESNRQHLVWGGLHLAKPYRMVLT